MEVLNRLYCDILPIISFSPFAPRVHERMHRKMMDCSNWPEWQSIRGGAGLDPPAPALLQYINDVSGMKVKIIKRLLLLLKIFMQLLVKIRTKQKKNSLA